MYIDMFISENTFIYRHTEIPMYSNTHVPQYVNTLKYCNT